MNAIDLKRAEFRHYLETSGVMDALSYALIKLYDEFEKPSDPVAFVRQHFKRPSDETEEFPKRIDDLDAFELIKKQEQELNMARQEIAKLRQMLNAMSSNSPIAEDDVQIQSDENVNPYQKLFNDPKYDGTLVKKYLTEELFKKLYELQSETPTIIDCLTKFNTLDTANASGIVALNASCYTTFCDLFEPIIKEIHCVDEFPSKYPESDWGEETMAFQKFEFESILGIEISCTRSLRNVPFVCGANEHDLQTILTIVQNAIQSTQANDVSEIDGEFYKITDVKEDEPIFNELQKSGLGFRSMNAQEHAFWPTGRALYVNGMRTQSILINEDEHLRFILIDKSGDLGLAYRNLIALIGKFSNGLDFERSDKYGWLSTNINLLGTGICCKIRLKLQHNAEHIENVAQKSGIKINLMDANQCENGFIVVELTNQSTFGLSEIQCVQQFYDGIKKFMEMLENIEMPNDITEKLNGIDAPELCKNVNESNEINIDGAEQPAANENDTANQDEQGEQKIDTEKNEIEGNVENTPNTVENIESNEKAEIDDNADAAQNDPNETLPNVEENIDGKGTAGDEDNATNILEPNDTNENNTNNTDENEIANEEKKINEIETENAAPTEPNEMENVASEQQPNSTENQDTKEADNQPIEV